MRVERAFLLVLEVALPQLPQTGFQARKLDSIGCLDLFVNKMFVLYRRRRDKHNRKQQLMSVQTPVTDNESGLVLWTIVWRQH